MGRTPRAWESIDPDVRQALLKKEKEVLAALRDYVPSDAMQMSASLCSGGVRERWRSMIEAAIDEREK